jgi:hypothetical protein
VRIGSLAKQSGVSVRCGSTKSRVCFRAVAARVGSDSTAPDIEPVHLIQQLYVVGLSSKVLVELLPCIEAPVEQYTPLLLGRLARKRDRIDAQIAALHQTRSKLDLVIPNAATP